MCEWYDGDTVKNKTLDSLRSMLESYCITSDYNTAQYINNFLTSFRELNRIPGEDISESNTLYLVLWGIYDPDFQIILEIQRNKYNNTLMQSVITIRKQEREVMNKRSTNRKPRNKMRRVCEKDYCYLDEYHPLKISRHQGEKDEDLVVTSDKIILKGKLLHVVQRLWQELYAKGIDFFV